jgi:hypothetical protein
MRCNRGQRYFDISDGAAVPPSDAAANKAVPKAEADLDDVSDADGSLACVLGVVKAGEDCSTIVVVVAVDSEVMVFELASAAAKKN